MVFLPKSTSSDYNHEKTSEYRIKRLCTKLRECAKSLQSCPILCDPVHYRPSSSSVHRTLQARILEWVTMPSSRGSSWPKDQISASLMSPALAGGFFTTSATWEALTTKLLVLYSSKRIMKNKDFIVPIKGAYKKQGNRLQHMSSDFLLAL